MTPDQLKKEINKAFGGEVISMASDDKFRVKYLPTGLLPIDVILSGGLPRNRIVEFYGGFSTLKSYIGLHAIATTQRSGGVCALIDTEHTFDEAWAASIGVDTKALLLPKCATGEDACDVTEALILNGVDLIVWDSVAATMPQDEGRKRLGGKESIQPGRQAAFMSAMLRRINAINEHTAIMFINQTREKIGMVFGSPETTPGGKALPFYASYRVALHKGKNTTEEIETFDGRDKGKVKRTSAYQVRAKLEKSKLSAPGREFLFVWDVKANAIDSIGFLIGLGLEHGTIKQTGMKWKCGRTEITGKDKFRTWLEGSTTAQNAILKEAGYDFPVGVPAPGKRKGAGQKPVLRLKRG